MAPSDDKRGAKTLRGVGVAATLSFQLVATIIVGFLVGHWLDGLLHTGPWLGVAGVMMGLVAGFVLLYHLSRILLK
ncbi:MAG: AtpZ/AtpI family protein [Thermaerobacter sp.]|nr:AtpZ/AtpI family protein [Thermaerobacter sp.]